MNTRKGLAAICFLGLLVLGSCKNETGQKVVYRYADLRGFFNAEAGRLLSEGKAEHKYVTKGASREENRSVPKNWKQELEIFADCDLNKPAWADSYQVDSTTRGTFTVVTYTCKENLPVQKVQLVTDSSGIVSVFIEKRNENLIYSSSQKLLYHAGRGYAVSGKEHVLFFSPSFYQIRAEYYSN